jgi:hypothetical protein
MQLLTLPEDLSARAARSGGPARSELVQLAPVHVAGMLRRLLEALGEGDDSL